MTTPPDPPRDDTPTCDSMADEPDPARSMTHIAGQPITIGGAMVIQRCSLCGAMLVDNRGQAAPLEPDGSAPKTATWSVGRLVRVTTGNPTAFQLLDDAEKLPDDSCIEII